MIQAALWLSGFVDVKTWHSIPKTGHPRETTNACWFFLAQRLAFGQDLLLAQDEQYQVGLGPALAYG